MARNDRDDKRKRSPKEGVRKGKKKVDIIARDGMDWVDYKDVNLLRKFMSDRGKIRARRVSGLSTQNQRMVADAIKLARELALVPYATRTVTERTSRPPRQPRGEQASEPSVESSLQPSLEPSLQPSLEPSFEPDVDAAETEVNAVDDEVDA